MEGIRRILALQEQIAGAAGRERRAAAATGRSAIRQEEALTFFGRWG